MPASKPNSSTQTEPQTVEVQHEAISSSKFRATVKRGVKDGFVMFDRTVDGSSLKTVPETVGFLTRGAYLRVPEGIEIPAGKKLIVQVSLIAVEDDEPASDLS